MARNGHYEIVRLAYSGFRTATAKARREGTVVGSYTSPNSGAHPVDARKK